MPLEKKIIPSVFANGIDSSADPKLTSQGLLQLTNGVVDYRGAIEKREGLSTLSGTYTDDDLAKYKARPILVGDNLARFNGATSTSGSFETVTTVGGFDCTVNKRYGDRRYTSYGGDCIQQDNILVMINENTNSPAVETYNTVTNKLIERNTSIVEGSSDTIRLLKIGSTLYGFIGCSTSGLGRFTIDSDGAVSGVTSFSTTSSTTAGGHIDVCCFKDSTSTVGILHQINGTENLELLIWTPASGEIVTTVAAATTLGNFCCYEQSDDKLFVAYEDENTNVITAKGFDSTGATIVASTTICTDTQGYGLTSICGKPDTSTTGRFYFTLFGGGQVNSCRIKTNTLTTAGSAGTEAWFHTGAVIASKPFQDSSGNWYIVLYYEHSQEDDDHKKFVIVDADDIGKIRGSFLDGYGWHYGGLNGPVNSLAVYASLAGSSGTDEWVFATAFLTDLSTDGTNYFYDTNLVSVNMSLSLPGRKCLETESHLHIPNSCPMEFDGANVFESGFLFSPGEVDLTLLSTGATTNISVGEYGYMACYEWLDEQGKIHRSAPTPVASITTTADTDQVAVRVRPISLTNRDQLKIVVAIYRTEVNGSQYFRWGEINNNPDVMYLSTNDSLADSQINGNSYIYTTGDVLEYRKPPPYWISCVHQNRMVVVNNEMPDTDLRYSNEFHPTRNVSFSPFLAIKCSSDGGAITGLTSFLDRIIIFKNQKIYATHGEGLSAAGTGQGYATPYLISEAIGCVNQKTIVHAPNGVMFESEDGIYILDKALNVQPIGDPIKYHYEQVSLVRAEIVPDKHYVIFLSDGDALVYDYSHEIWSTFSNHKAADGVVAGNRLYFRGGSDSNIYVQYPGIFRDSASTYSLVIRTGWFPFAQLGGYMRLYTALLLGQNISVHKLRIKTAFDFDPVWIDNQTFSSSTLGSYLNSDSHFGAGQAAGYRDKSYMLEVHTSQQKCTSVMFEISDETTGGDNPDAAYSMSGISFLVGLKPFLRRFGTTRKVGT